MTDTTYDEARRCPKCGELMGETGTVFQRDRSKRITVTCGNSRCTWYNTNKIILVNPDGSIPEPTAHVKRFPQIPDLTEKYREEVDRSLRQQTQG